MLQLPMEFWCDLLMWFCRILSLFSGASSTICSHFSLWYNIESEATFRVGLVPWHRPASHCTRVYKTLKNTLLTPPWVHTLYPLSDLSAYLQCTDVMCSHATFLKPVKCMMLKLWTYLQFATTSKSILCTCIYLYNLYSQAAWNIWTEPSLSELDILDSCSWHCKCL